MNPLLLTCTLVAKACPLPFHEYRVRLHCSATLPSYQVHSRVAYLAMLLSYNALPDACRVLLSNHAEPCCGIGAGEEPGHQRLGS